MYKCNKNIKIKYTINESCQLVCSSLGSHKTYNNQAKHLNFSPVVRFAENTVVAFPRVICTYRIADIYVFNHF